MCHHYDTIRLSWRRSQHTDRNRHNFTTHKAISMVLLQTFLENRICFTSQTTCEFVYQDYDLYYKTINKFFTKLVYYFKVNFWFSLSIKNISFNFTVVRDCMWECTTLVMWTKLLLPDSVVYYLKTTDLICTPSFIANTHMISVFILTTLYSNPVDEFIIH